MGVLRAKVAGVWQEINFGGPGADPGDVKATCAAVAPAGWLLFGATYPGADVAYPDLWAVVPAAWKVGTDLVVPDATNCTLLGGGTLGSVGGATSKALAAANLPVHGHTMAHTHGINHDHASVEYSLSDALATTVSATHTHSIAQDNAVGGAGGIYLRGVAQQYLGSAYMASAGAHEHTINTVAVNIPSFSGNSGASSAANTGNGPGTAATIDLYRKYLGVNWIVKT